MQREQQSSTIDHLIELGYTEVVDCSGTGMGFCRFEFAAADGQKLAVVAVNNQQNEDGSTLHRWWFEDN